MAKPQPLRAQLFSLKVLDDDTVEEDDSVHSEWVVKNHLHPHVVSTVKTKGGFYRNENPANRFNSTSLAVEEDHKLVAISAKDDEISKRSGFVNEKNDIISNRISLLIVVCKQSQLARLPEGMKLLRNRYQQNYGPYALSVCLVYVFLDEAESGKCPEEAEKPEYFGGVRFIAFKEKSAHLHRRNSQSTLDRIPRDASGDSRDLFVRVLADALDGVAAYSDLLSAFALKREKMFREMTHTPSGFRRLFFEQGTEEEKQGTVSCNSLALDKKWIDLKVIKPTDGDRRITMSDTDTNADFFITSSSSYADWIDATSSSSSSGSSSSSLYDFSPFRAYNVPLTKQHVYLSSMFQYERIHGRSVTSASSSSPSSSSSDQIPVDFVNLMRKDTEESKALIVSLKKAGIQEKDTDLLPTGFGTVYISDSITELDEITHGCSMKVISGNSALTTASSKLWTIETVKIKDILQHFSDLYLALAGGVAEKALVSLHPERIIQARPLPTLSTAILHDIKMSVSIDCNKKVYRKLAKESIKKSNGQFSNSAFPFEDVPAFIPLRIIVDLDLEYENVYMGNQIREYFYDHQKSGKKVDVIRSAFLYVYSDIAAYKRLKPVMAKFAFNKPHPRVRHIIFNEHSFQKQVLSFLKVIHQDIIQGFSDLNRNIDKENSPVKRAQLKEYSTL